MLQLIEQDQGGAISKIKQVLGSFVELMVYLEWEGKFLEHNRLRKSRNIRTVAELQCLMNEEEKRAKKYLPETTQKQILVICGDSLTKFNEEQILIDFEEILQKGDKKTLNFIHRLMTGNHMGEANRE